MMLEIDIESDEEWDSSTDWSLLVRRAAESALAESAFPQLAQGPRPVEISVRLTGDEEVRALNAQWRGKDKPTNVLSFPAPDQPGAEGPRHLGDIALAYETLVRESEEESKALADHFAHLIVHGILHLLGYDHEDEEEAEDMEALEVKALATLGIADPYRDMAA